MSNRFKSRLPNLKSQFTAPDPEKVLIYDADILAYQVSATVKTLPTAIRNFQRGVQERMFLAGCGKAAVHLTASDSFKTGRHLIKAFKPYQGNRDNKAKPGLLEPLREAMANPNNWLDDFIEVTLHREIEADDQAMIDSYYYKERGVVSSEDKDLRMTPYSFYEHRRGVVLPPCGLGSLWLHVTEGGKEALEGHGRIFFWAQMLMGDQADNIRGLDRGYGKQYGPKGALEALDGIDCEHEAANIVVDLYKSGNQNPWPEAFLLHMLRSPADTIHDKFGEIEWTPQNEEFLNECDERDWFAQEGECDTSLRAQ